MKILRRENGITLVALIITIIILIILAAVTILTLTNDNMIETAIKGAENYQQAQYKEAEDINKLTSKINEAIKGIEEANRGNLPNPPKGIEIGDIVELPDKWKGEPETVDAVYVGNETVVPVPKGFSYVGGNIQTGVIISDSVLDKYVKGEDKTTWEYTKNLQGNQFIWIPCEISEYKKTDWGKQNGQWDKTTSDIEKVQIEKYGGFYVGRYEAGLANTISEFTETQQQTGTNQIYNTAGIPQSKAGIIPWMFIDWEKAKVNSESMYDTNYVSSGLITGTQWDVILNKIIKYTDLEENDIKTDSSKWGNYRNTQIPYVGRVATAYYQEQYWHLMKFGELTKGTTNYYEKDNTYGDLLTTGASKETERYHLYDIAGNLWEWTDEVSMYEQTNNYYVLRGGANAGSGNSATSAFRFCSAQSSFSCLDFGFRTVLYLK